MHKKYQSKITFLTQHFWLKRAPSRGKLLYKFMGGDFFFKFLKRDDFVNEFGKPRFTRLAPKKHIANKRKKKLLMLSALKSFFKK